MSVKSVFLNGYIIEEIYVHQPPSFERYKNLDFVYKLNKTFYGLKQAPRAQYERLNNLVLKNDFTRGKVDITLFCKSFKNNILIVQIYVDGIIFGFYSGILCQEFSKSMLSLK